MSEERVRVEVVRSGGFTGMTRTASADTGQLDEDRAQHLRSLLQHSALGSRRSAGASAGRHAARGADRFQYDVTVLRGPTSESFVLQEGDLTEEDRALVRWVLSEGPPRT